jgi:hypothetical protein
VSERIDWGEVLGGGDPWGVPPHAQKRAREIRDNEPARRQFEAAWGDETNWPREVLGRDESGNAILGARYNPRALQQRLAEQGSGARWFGSGQVPCPECEVEQRAAVANPVRIEKVDHSCWVEDKRLEQRLADRVLIRRAEQSGAIRSATYRPGPNGGMVPADDLARELAEHDQRRMEAELLRQRVTNGRL